MNSLEERRARLDESIELEDVPKALHPSRRIKGLAPRLQRAIEKTKDAIERIEEQGHLTEQAKAQGIDALKDGLQQNLRELEAEAAGQLERARKKTQRRPLTDPSEITAHEVRKQRAWARVEADLKMGVAPTQLPTLYADDATALAAIRDEIPAWLDQEGRARLRRPDEVAEEKKVVLDLLAEAEKPHLSPALQRAIDGAKAAEDAFKDAAANFKRTRVEGVYNNLIIGVQVSDEPYPDNERGVGVDLTSVPPENVINV